MRVDQPMMISDQYKETIHNQDKDTLSSKDIDSKYDMSLSKQRDIKKVFSIKHTIKLSGKSLKIKIPLSLKYKETNLYFYISNDKFRTYGDGESFDEAYDIFCENLVSLYQDFTLENDDNLTIDAIALKNNLLAHFSLD